jgi:hypothetical protein
MGGPGGLGGPAGLGRDGGLGGQGHLGGHRGLGGLAGLVVRLVDDAVGVGMGLGQHVVPAALGVAGQVPAVLLGLGHVVVGGLLGAVQDVDRLEMRVGAAAPEAVVLAGVTENAAPEPVHLFLQGRALAQQPHELVLDLMAERPHMLLVEPAAAEVRASE